MSPKSRHSPFSVRGVIEGFYGRPFSWDERAKLVAHLGQHGMNRYVYAPKNDPLHRESWREPYAPEQLRAFRALADEGARCGVDLVYAIAPGLTYDAREPRDFAQLEAEMAALLDAGAGGIALLFDDITPDSTAVDPGVQAELVARAAASVARRAPGADFWFVGNFYTGTADDLRADRGFFASLYPRRAVEYFAAYGERVPPAIPIMWTGPGVFSARITADDAAAFRELAGRPVLLWDNFPVNDAMPSHLFLGAYRGREPEIAEPLGLDFWIGLPEAIVGRHPFPGPGLAIRIVGEVTEDRLALLREADAIAQDELRASGLAATVWQFPVVLLADIRSVGVQGDERTYGHPIVLRPVSSEDAMTADWSRLPYELLEQISTRITNEVPGVNRVVLDITSKPPGTIEWE